MSHFEDTHFPNCNTTNPIYGNDNYFLMCNAGNPGIIRRFLKPEERNALCDIGYSVKTTFGSSTVRISATAFGPFNYGGIACAGTTVAGTNDGINNAGSYTYIGNTGAVIAIGGTNSILLNDTNATGFECLQDLTATIANPTTLSAITGTTTTTVNVTSTLPGLHLLRYVPTNGTQRGNITYVYLYVSPIITGCTTAPTACNLVNNGNFEANTVDVTQLADFIMSSNYSNTSKICNWFGKGFETIYFLQNNTTLEYSIPCNIYGNQNGNVTGNNAYAGLRCYSFSNGTTTSGILATKLSNPLLPNTSYQLSFKVSQADFFKNRNYQLQGFISSLNPANIFSGMITNPQLMSGILVSNAVVTSNFNGWDTINLSFTTNATQTTLEFLYLGILNNSLNNIGTTTSIILGCLFDYTFNPSNGLSYFIDNVSLIATGGATLNLPQSICPTQSLSNLAIFLEATPPNGVFSGTGVSFAGGIYSFNAVTAGVGTFVISYTYNNNLGCPVTISDSIVVSAISTNTIVIDAMNDDFSTMPINPATGGITTSVYSNDTYNGSVTSSANINNVTFSLVTPITIAGATINNQGVISIPSDVAIGTYTLNYRLSAIGNCTTSDVATVTIIVGNITTPTIVAGLRANNVVNLIGLQSNNKSIISGFLSSYNDILQNKIARLNTNLTLDTTFNASGPSPSNQPPQSMAIQSDDKIIVVGSFTGFSGGSNGFGIARLNQNGSIDTGFNTGGTGIGLVNFKANTCAIQQDGKILVGGQFGSYNGVNCRSLIRLNSNGSIDSSFTFPNYPSSWVSRVLIQPDGKVLVEGLFGFAFTDPTNRHLIRLNSDGTLDGTFTTGYTGPTGQIPSVSYSNVITLQNMALRSDGKIIIVGAFTNYNGSSTNNIIRLLSNGQIDPIFNFSAGVERGINDLIIEPVTNKLIIGGEFTTFGTTPVKKLIRLNTDGTIDTSFNIGTGTTDSVTFPGCTFCSNYVKALKLQPDGKILVGGKFTTFNGLSATNITRIFGDAGVQAKSSILEYQSEPEIDINPFYNGITIYPNPSKGIYTIDLSATKEPTTITLYNIIGKQVFQQILSPESENQIEITNLSNGYYIAHITNSAITSQHKLIKN